jgi:hypothetical protein
LHISDSIFVASALKDNSYGGATYIDSNTYDTDGTTICYLNNCHLEGYYAIHAMGDSITNIKDSVLDGAHDCVCTANVTEDVTARVNVTHSEVRPVVNVVDGHANSTISFLDCDFTAVGEYGSFPGALTFERCRGINQDTIKITTEEASASGTSITIPHLPVDGTYRLYKNGLRLLEGSGKGFTRSGTVVTLTTTAEAGDVYYHDYDYIGDASP